MLAGQLDFRKGPALPWKFGGRRVGRYGWTVGAVAARGYTSTQAISTCGRLARIWRARGSASGQAELDFCRESDKVPPPLRKPWHMAGLSRARARSVHPHPLVGTSELELLGPALGNACLAGHASAPTASQRTPALLPPHPCIGTHAAHHHPTLRPRHHHNSHHAHHHHPTTHHHPSIHHSAKSIHPPHPPFHHPAPPRAALATTSIRLGRLPSPAHHAVLAPQQHQRAGACVQPRQRSSFITGQTKFRPLVAPCFPVASQAKRCLLGRTQPWQERWCFIDVPVDALPCCAGQFDPCD